MWRGAARHLSTHRTPPHGNVVCGAGVRAKSSVMSFATHISRAALLMARSYFAAPGNCSGSGRSEVEPQLAVWLLAIKCLGLKISNHGRAEVERGMIGGEALAPGAAALAQVFP